MLARHTPQGAFLHNHALVAHSLSGASAMLCLLYSSHRGTVGELRALVL